MESEPKARRLSRAVQFGLLGLTASTATLAIALLATGPEPARGAFPGVVNGQIAFQSGRDRTGNDQIFVVGPGGENPTNISNHDETDTSPSFSADGQRIVFDGDPGTGSDELFVMDVNGENRRRLTRSQKDESEPVFSPNGSTIAFTSFVDPGYPEVHLIDATGSNERQLVAAPAQASDFAPAWSPSGSQIAFVRTPSGGESSIYVVNADGSGATRISPLDGKYDFDPDYSPDGSKIAFASDRDGNNEIYVMNANGGNVQRLTNSASSDSNPAWSPDGTMIAFQRAPADSGNAITLGAGEILVMDTSGKVLRNLTRDSGEHSDEPGDQEPDWQPVGGAADTTRPALTGGPIRIAPRFEVSTRPTPPRAVLSGRGSTIGFRVSEPASVKLAVERVYPGIKRKGRGGTRCVRARSRGVPRRKRCTAAKLIGWLVRNSSSGAKRVPFSGRIGRKALAPGRYRIRAGAVDANANPARHRTSREFTIVRR